jgi:hypothetical protein
MYTTNTPAATRRWKIPALRSDRSFTAFFIFNMKPTKMLIEPLLLFARLLRQFHMPTFFSETLPTDRRVPRTLFRPSLS